MSPMKELLEKYDQMQVLRFYDELSKEEQQTLDQEIAQIDFSMIEQAMKQSSGTGEDQLESLPTLTIDQIREKEEQFKQIGLEQLRGGKVAAVLLAGGQGSRLGFEGPKGTLNVGINRQLYLFEILIHNMRQHIDPLGTKMHLYVMTSDRNHEETVRFFKEHAYFEYPAEYIHFFKQDMAPSLDHHGKILLESKGHISMTPNGNGGWFSSLQRAGLIDQMKAEGIEWLNVFSVDNVLQNIGDPVFIGATIAQGHAVGAKVIAKTNPEEKVGAICLRNGRPSVVEYSELTEEMRNAVDENGNYKYHFGVTLNYLFHVPTMEERAVGRLPIHKANKKIACINEAGEPVIPSEPNGYKLETFIFDILGVFDGVTSFEVVREDEFAPIKNKVGVDSLETARELLTRKTGIEL